VAAVAAVGPAHSPRGAKGRGRGRVGGRGKHSRLTPPLRVCDGGSTSEVACVGGWVAL
jgi:hypothetical protein